MLANYLSIGLCCIATLLPIDISWLVLLFSGLMQVASIILKSMAKNFHDLSREAQRRALLENSFGKSIEDFNVSELYSKVGEKLLKRAQIYDFEGDYYSSNSKTGYRRFKENIQESCFFSRNLINLEKNRIIGKVTIMLSSLIIVTFLLLIGIFDNVETVEYQNFRYIVGGLSIIIFFVLNDDYESYTSCIAASKLFKEVDSRLAKLESIEELFSSFGDYSVAALMSTPIPTTLYKKKKDLINDLWLQIRTNPVTSKTNEFLNELDAITRQPSQSNSVEDFGIDWVVLQLKSKLIHSDRKGSDKIMKMQGWSGNPVFEVILSENSKEVYQLIVKFFSNKNEIKKELNIIKRLNEIGTDLLCYTLLEDDFVSKNVLVYYHATHRTQEQMIPLSIYFQNVFLNNHEFNRFCLRLTDFVTSVTNTLDKIDPGYKISTVKEYIDQLKDDLPPNYILDLTGECRCKFVNKDLIISSNQAYPDLDLIDHFHVVSDETLRDIKTSQGKKGWVKIPLEINYRYVSSQKTFLYSKLHNKDILCIIMPTSIFKTNVETFIKNNRFGVIINPLSKKLSSFNDFFQKENGISSLNLSPDSILRLLQSVGDKELKLSTRHNDFHDRNILFSKNSSKIIDIGGMSVKPISSDVNRLEISIILETSNVIELSLAELISCYKTLFKIDSPILTENGKKLLNFLMALREGLNIPGKIKISQFEDMLTLYSEILVQIGYSILGTRQVPDQLVQLLDMVYTYILNTYGTNTEHSG
jgi:hypothetical protein